MNYISVQMTDNSVSSSWWKNLVRHFVHTGDELEIRCWKEETAEIQNALIYGKITEDRNEVSIRGTVTDELLLELLDDEPTDKSIYNKMTKYFTINVKNELCDFCSAHYGTEMYIENLREEDISFVEDVFSKFADKFSISIEKD